MKARFQWEIRNESLKAIFLTPSQNPAGAFGIRPGTMPVRRNIGLTSSNNVSNRCVSSGLIWFAPFDWIRPRRVRYRFIRRLWCSSEEPRSSPPNGLASFLSAGFIESKSKSSNCADTATSFDRARFLTLQGTAGFPSVCRWRCGSIPAVDSRPSGARSRPASATPRKRAAHRQRAPG